MGDHVVLQDHMTKPWYLLYHNAYSHNIWQDCDLTCAAFIHKVRWPYNHVVSSDHVTNSNHYISTTTMPMATKLGRVEMYNDELPAIKPKVSLITWSWKLNWNIRFAISLLLKGLWPPNLARWWLTMRRFHK